MAQNNAQNLATELNNLINANEGYSAYIKRATSTDASVYSFIGDCKVIVIDSKSDSVISLDSEDIILNCTYPAADATARDLLKTLLYGF